ncbi:MAG: biotin--protein ligase [Thermomicrobiales bacterium]
MHGEYKTPGGKLVAVDFVVSGEVMRGVQVSGDFFLYPDEALDDLNRALEGLPVALVHAEAEARLRDGLRPDAHLLGTSPEGIAVAVRRAIEAGEGEGERA